MAYDVGIVASVTMKRTDEVAGGRYASGRSGRCRCPSGARCQGAPPYVIRFVSRVSGLVIGGHLPTRLNAAPPSIVANRGPPRRTTSPIGRRRTARQQAVSR